MAAILDKEALAYLLEQVLQADEDAPVMLTLKRAGVLTASDLMSLEVSQDMPLKYDRPTEGSEKARKNVPLLPVEMCQIKGLKDYIRYHMMNVANKYYESHEDWEKLTAKGFIRFRVNIARLLFENTRVPSMPRVFTANSRSTHRSLPKLSLMPTLFSSTSPLPVSVMEPGMA